MKKLRIFIDGSASNYNSGVFDAETGKRYGRVSDVEVLQNGHLTEFCVSAYPFQDAFDEAHFKEQYPDQLLFEEGEVYVVTEMQLIPPDWAQEDAEERNEREVKVVFGVGGKYDAGAEVRDLATGQALYGLSYANLQCSPSGAPRVAIDLACVAMEYLPDLEGIPDEDVPKAKIRAAR